MGQEIYASFPYSVGSGLPHHLQEPWVALIDSGAVTSIAPSSFAPHVPISHLIVVSWSMSMVERSRSRVKKKITYVTHVVVMHITFLIVDDVLNPIIGLDALHQNSAHVPLVSDRQGIPSAEEAKGSSSLLQESLLMPQVWSFLDMSRVQYSSGMILSAPYSILNQRVRSLQRSTLKSTQRLG